MKAIIIKGFGGLENLVIEELPNPIPQKGQALIEVKAFGINHAETHMRKGEWAEAAQVSGIECVGIVRACPGGEIAEGTKVVAFMGGLGRTINGSYAEYTRAPVSNVALIEADLPWAVLAAIPETYATAWTCLFRNLDIQRGQLLLLRGATSSLGQAANWGEMTINWKLLPFSLKLSGHWCSAMRWGIAVARTRGSWALSPLPN